MKKLSSFQLSALRVPPYLLPDKLCKAWAIKD